MVFLIPDRFHPKRVNFCIHSKDEKPCAVGSFSFWINVVLSGSFVNYFMKQNDLMN